MSVSHLLSLLTICWATLAVGLCGCGHSSTAANELPVADQPDTHDLQPTPPKTFPNLDLLATQGELPEIDIALTERARPDSAVVVLEELRNLSIIHASDNVPLVLGTPYTGYSNLSYCRAMARLEHQRQADVQWLQSIDVGQLPDADEHSIQAILRKRETLLRRLQNEMPQRINNSLNATLNGLSLDIELFSRFIRRELNDRDPEDFEDMLRHDAEVARLTMLLNTAIIVERLLNQPSNWEQLKQEFAASAKRNKAEREASGSNEKPVGLNDDRLQTAAFDLLREWESPAIEWVELRVGSESQVTEAVHYEVTDNGLVEFNCRWETFTALTIEKESDGSHAIFAHDLVRYEQAPRSVPTEKWHLARRWRLAPIALDQN